MSDLRTFEEIAAADADAVGGKGQSLGVLLRAGLPVPPGFCVTTAAYRRLAGRTPRDEPALATAIADAYRRLGGGPVAVRSSATAEDGAVTSFAGQQETVLGVTGEAAVLDAVGRCWESLHTERAVAYRRHQGVDDRGLAMAVVVQRFVPAEVAGVLFTRDPLDAKGGRMLVEASWGVGEVVVSGQVTPDRYYLDPATGAVLARHVAPKMTRWSPEGPRPVPAEMQMQPCLDKARLAELAALARRVEEVFGGPRDVEWAWAGGRFWLLQARPITAGGADERRQVRQEEIAALRARAHPGGTVWARFNLSEILPEPTPMTWAVVRRFMSGRGGFGLMYRDLGFDVDPRLDEEGTYDLVCDRPYCNLSREALLQSRRLPLGYPFAALKADPRKALYPQPTLDRSRATWRFWLGLPVLLPMMVVGETRRLVRLNALARTLADRLRNEVLPAFAAETAAEAARDLGGLDDPALLDCLGHWVRRTLYDFARDSLKPTVLANLALENLKQGLARTLGPEAARAAATELAMGARPDPEADLAQALDDLAAGRLERSAFLERFGHRGRQEMELSEPRWAEDAGAVDRLLAGRSASTQAPSASAGTACTVAGARGLSAPPTQAPSASAGTGYPVAGAPGLGGDARALQGLAIGKAAWERIAAEAKLAGPLRAALETELQHLHTYLSLRETCKHYLLRGYALIRRILVELDRRHRLSGGIFFLTPEELPRLVRGEDLSEVVRQRRRRRALALSLEVPEVLFSDDLEAIGRPAPVEAADTLQGVPLSAGVAEAPALVLTEPTADVPADPYILVCPTTDPAWVPLFARARGLVMETGGVLSHGAIVAREYGLPAVAGLPGVQRRLRSGQRLRVDGGSGTVAVLGDERDGH